MSEFWILSNFLREKCYEDADTQKLCQKIARKYMEKEKNEIRSQNARGENIILKLDVGNLESLCQAIIENNETHSELDALLREYYQEHLRISFATDECEIEKLYGYEEIKIELETRDCVSVYQQFYLQKITRARKMEQRNVVKQYRAKEKEFLKTENERLKLNESLKKIKKKAEEAKARVQELHERIFRLVKGWKKLELIYSQRCAHKYGSQSSQAMTQRTVDKTKAMPQNVHKGGLSSRLLLDFNQNKAQPPVPFLHRIRTITPNKGLSRLLQQAEVLRKSMQRSSITLAAEPPVQKPPSILKLPSEKPTETYHKTVSFETDMLEETPTTIVEPSPTGPHITLDTTISDVPGEPELNTNQSATAKSVSAKKDCIIIEDIVLKPAGTPLPVRAQVICDPDTKAKRKLVEKDHDYLDVAKSPSKKKRVDGDTEKLDSSLEIGSKSFLDVFLNCSKESPTEVSSVAEVKGNTIQPVEEKLESKTKPIAHKKELKNEDNKKSTPFDGFENFFAGLTGGNGSDNNDNQSAGDMSFDFFEGNDNTENDPDGGSENFSFKF